MYHELAAMELHGGSVRVDSKVAFLYKLGGKNVVLVVVILWGLLIAGLGLWSLKEKQNE